MGVGLSVPVGEIVKVSVGVAVSVGTSVGVKVSVSVGVSVCARRIPMGTINKTRINNAIVFRPFKISPLMPNFIGKVDSVTLPPDALRKCLQAISLSL
jgi:hypothetical protein